MQRQDDFLRTLMCIIDTNINGQTPYHGLGVIKQAIESRLPDLKPIVFENMLDLSHGLSTNGVNICGDKSSIAAVQEALHYSAQVETFWRPEYIKAQQAQKDHDETSRQWRDQFDAMQRRAMRAEAALPEWSVHTKGGPNSTHWEICVIRKGYAHGIQSYGWFGADKIHISSSGGPCREKVSQELWDNLVGVAAITAERMNRELSKTPS